MKRFFLFLTAIIIGWTLIGKMDKQNWDTLTAPEKKAIVSVITDRYFEAVNCGGADFRILTDENEILFFVNCVKPRLHT
jgi:hypothetical protein